MNIIIAIVNTTVRVLSLLVFISSLLSYFMDPYHPIRRTLSLVVDPLLSPIRKLVPPMGGVDWSPLILIIALQILGSVLIAILRSFL
jgi:YggT family protein